MRGTVSTMAGASTDGVIRADNARLYAFALADIRGVAPRIDQEVMFDIAHGRAANLHAVTTPGTVEKLRRRDWLAFYLSPRGRISRRDYWLYGVLFVVLAQLTLSPLFVMGSISPGAAAVSLLMLWVTIALTCKRFQDCGYPGWFCLAPYALMLCTAVLMIAGTLGVPHSVVGSALSRFGILSAGAAVLSGFWSFLWVPLWRGEPGYNRFGPDPLRTA